MFSVLILRQTFLKNRVRMENFYGRTKLSKSTSNWPKLNFMEVNCETGFQIMKNSNLKPKGFDVVYVCPLLKWLKYFGPATIVFWAVLAIDFYYYIKHKDYLKIYDETFGNVTAKEKIMCSMYFSSFILFVNLSVPRIPIAIFRKGNEFKTLLYGHFGPLTKKYVTHGMREVQPVADNGIYSLKGKKVFILSNGFRNLKDYESVIKMT